MEVKSLNRIIRPGYYYYEIELEFIKIFEAKI